VPLMSKQQIRRVSKLATRLFADRSDTQSVSQLVSDSISQCVNNSVLIFV